MFPANPGGPDGRPRLLPAVSVPQIELPASEARFASAPRLASPYAMTTTVLSRAPVEAARPQVLPRLVDAVKKPSADATSKRSPPATLWTPATPAPPTQILTAPKALPGLVDVIQKPGTDATGGPRLDPDGGMRVQVLDATPAEGPGPAGVPAADMERHLRAVCGGNAREVLVIDQGDGTQIVHITVAGESLARLLAERLRHVPGIHIPGVRVSVYVDP